jgi:hypothetical protein
MPGENVVMSRMRWPDLLAALRCHKTGVVHACGNNVLAVHQFSRPLRGLAPFTFSFPAVENGGLLSSVPRCGTAANSGNDLLPAHITYAVVMKSPHFCSQSKQYD